MPIDVQATLRQALQELQTERDRIERQIAVIEAVLESGTDREPGRPAKRTKKKAAVKGRKPLTEAQREAARARMKAYWADRKAAAAKQ